MIILLALVCNCRPRNPKQAMDEGREFQCQSNPEKIGIAFQVSMMEHEAPASFEEMVEGSNFWKYLQMRMKETIEDCNMGRIGKEMLGE